VIGGSGFVDSHLDDALTSRSFFAWLGRGLGLFGESFGLECGAWLTKGFLGTRLSLGSLRLTRAIPRHAFA